MSTQAQTDGKGTDTLDKETIHHILSNERRKHVLSILDEMDRIDKGELATLVTAREMDTDPNDLSSQERKRVMVALQQCHLPKLEDNDVITWDGNTIKASDELDDVIEHLEYDSRKTKLRYAAEAVLGALPFIVIAAVSL